MTRWGKGHAYRPNGPPTPGVLEAAAALGLVVHPDDTDTTLGRRVARETRELRQKLRHNGE